MSGDRLHILSPDGFGRTTTIKIGEQVLTNVTRVVITIDAQSVNTAEVTMLFADTDVVVLPDAVTVNQVEITT
jgi:hypothetical protein